MSALALLLAQAAILAVTLGAVLAATWAALLFAGRALSPARPARVRAVAGAFAGLCVAAIAGSAAAGFWGAGALLYLVSR